jgi:SMC interacting uncharacterized protein involved in chromosome segregation
MVTITDPELRRRINRNLQELGDGTVARRKEAARAARAARKEQAKKDKRRIKAIDKRLLELLEEQSGLQSYLDEMLEQGEEWPGGIDETDHALEGCTAEIVDLLDERETLQRMIEND